MENSQRYRKIWRIEEDILLNEIVKRYNAKNWKTIAQEISQKISKVRTEKQCRERWNNYLKLNTRHCEWTDTEISLFFELQSTIGNKWSKISAFFPNKSKNSIKNFYYSTIRRNIRRFNNGKIDEEQIKGPIDDIMKIPEIREILSSQKSFTKNDLKEMKLSAECLERIHRINGFMITITESGFPDVENFSEWDGVEFSELNEFPNESSPYIDQSILWD
ncbi:hypothetical protein SteCoe_17224 [Stentor coeruleus]|uniref:Myb-like DNA-binding domain containing protein n=1 Tax=Stentor coeruleus TaxID=5963 RepID=A0A1R2BZI6_9CILI|nr:hypothetical protein SteCoe_17224 [Stentor coeruleus]